MTATIYSNNLIIGSTNLQIGDESMGCVFGDFIPTSNYYNSVQDFVWKFNSANKPDYQKWNSLNINVQLENGYFLSPIGGYTFDDLEELPHETKRINIAGLFRHVIEDFFQTTPPKSFIKGPWQTISIEEKFLFEKELQKEIKRTSSSLFGLLKSTSEHILSTYECSSVAKLNSTDDILFAIHNKDVLDKTYAVVHLTFSGKTEKNTAFPSTILYDNFDTFQVKRMYPDKEE